MQQRKPMTGLLCFAFKMADHWVSEVFPPKFEFKTVSDLLKKDKNEKETSPEKLRISESYNKVYLKLMREQELEKFKDIGSKDGEVVQELSLKETKLVREKTEPEAKTNSAEDCIWTNDEIKVLRKTFQKLKLQNVYLTGVVESLQKELQIYKEREWKASNAYNALKEKWSELKKRYARAKISCKSYKEDLKSYYESLKTAGKEVDVLRNEKSVTIKDLTDVKVKLDLERIKSSQLIAELRKKENEKVIAVEHCEFVTRQQCKFEETALRKEIFRLQEELRKANNENTINKKSLENLRNHFISSKLNNEQNGVDVISIADIDYS